METLNNKNNFFRTATSLEPCYDIETASYELEAINLSDSLASYSDSSSQTVIKLPAPQPKNTPQTSGASRSLRPDNLYNNNGPTATTKDSQPPQPPKLAGLMPPPTDPLFYEWMDMYEKLHRLNRILETKVNLLIKSDFTLSEAQWVQWLQRL